MEFSFEYTDFWQGINAIRDLIYAFAFAGVLLLYLPARLVVNILGRAANEKLNIIAGSFVISTWLTGALGVGLLSFIDPSTISLFLVYVAIATVNLLYITTNANLIFKVYKGIDFKNKFAVEKG